MFCVAKKEAPGIPLPAMVAATWGGFIYEGLLACNRNDRRTQDILEAWNQGCIELVIAACVHLPELWDQISVRLNEADTDFPGVFEYEVVSPLGTYLGDYLLSHQGTMPDVATVKEKIQQLMHAFFAQSPQMVAG